MFPNFFQFFRSLAILFARPPLTRRRAHACVRRASESDIQLERETRERGSEKDGWRQSICVLCDGHARLSSVPVRFLHSRRERSTLHAEIDCRVWKNSRKEKENAPFLYTFLSSWLNLITGQNSVVDSISFVLSFSLAFSSLPSFLLADSFLCFDFASRKFLIDGFCAFKSHGT